MNRTLFQSAPFLRAARKLVKRQPEIAADLLTVFRLLAEDAFQPQLKTHKLQGKLSGCYACSVGYDCRIVFEIIEQGGGEVITLNSIGSHDDVY